MTLLLAWKEWFSNKVDLFMHLLSSAAFYKFTFSKESFRNTIRVSSCLDHDQDRRSVGLDLGPNCLQMLTADDKSRWINTNFSAESFHV